MSTRSFRYSTMRQHFTKGVTASTDRDALAFLEAATIYNTNQQRAIIRLVRDLKRTGLWSKMKAIYPFVGGTATTHKWNLKDPRDADAAFRLVFYGGWTHDNTGVLPNGTSGYANTLCTVSANFSSSSAHCSLYMPDNNAATTNIDFGVAKDGNSLWQCIPKYNWIGTASLIFDMYNVSTNRILAANSNGSGYYIDTRTSATVHKALRNNVQVGSTNTGTSSGFTNLNLDIYLAARNTNNSPTNASSNKLSFATIGDGLTDTDATNLYNIVDLYQKRLGRAV